MQHDRTHRATVTPLQVIRYTAFMGRDLLGLLATQEAHSGAPVPHPGPPGRSALVRVEG